MKTLMHSRFKYGGFGIQVQPRKKPIEVEIVGVMAPPDPGFVTIHDGKEQYEVPTLVLKESPRIEWGKMLSDQQIKNREACGMLFGTGTDEERKLIPLAECPLEAACQ